MPSHTDKSMVIAGNIFDGHAFYGPFEDHEAAIEWAENELNSEWLVATLVKPIV